MEVLCCSEASVDFQQTTQCYIPQGSAYINSTDIMHDCQLLMSVLHFMNVLYPFLFYFIFIESIFGRDTNFLLSDAI
jgi:hypothetical protein